MFVSDFRPTLLEHVRHKLYGFAKVELKNAHAWFQKIVNIFIELATLQILIANCCWWHMRHKQNIVNTDMLCREVNLTWNEIKIYIHTNSVIKMTVIFFALIYEYCSLGHKDDLTIGLECFLTYFRILNFTLLHKTLIWLLLNLFTTIHDGNFRRHSSMNVAIKWHKFSSNIYYIYVFFVIWSWKLR